MRLLFKNKNEPINHTNRISIGTSIYKVSSPQENYYLGIFMNKQI